MNTKARVSSLLFASLALCAAALIGCGTEGADAPEPTKTDTQLAPGSVISVGVTNMTWGSCYAKVRATLSKLDGVQAVSVNAKTKIAEVTLNQGATLDRAVVERALANGNFGVSSFAPKGWSTTAGVA